MLGGPLAVQRWIPVGTVRSETRVSLIPADELPDAGRMREHEVRTKRAVQRPAKATEPHLIQCVPERRMCSRASVLQCCGGDLLRVLDVALSWIVRSQR